MATLDFVDELLTRNSFFHGTDGSEGNQSYEEEKKDTFLLSLMARRRHAAGRVTKEGLADSL